MAFIWTRGGAETARTVFDQKKCDFTLAEFTKKFTFDAEISGAEISVFGDVKFRLYINGVFAADGPVCAGGDYANCDAMPKQYFNILNLTEDSECLRKDGKTLDLYASVFMPPEVMTDYSVGTPCFWLKAEVTLKNGEKRTFETDESWNCRENPQYLSASDRDLTLDAPEFGKAAAVTGRWNLVPSPIPPLDYKFIDPKGDISFTVGAGQTESRKFDFPMIESAYVFFNFLCSGECKVTVEITENGTPHARESMITNRNTTYRGLRMQSIGDYTVTVENRSESDATVCGAGMWACAYPIAQPEECGSFDCSDPYLTDLYALCRHTLKINRQTLHLDSPLHQETLGCTGDYAIESLMNYMTFGDPRLTRLDIVRTADMLRMHDGMMFHTSYSLIWVTMIRDYVLYSGDFSVAKECEDAIRILFARFAKYGNLLQDAPNYMFIDWINKDGFSMHHPPKALGQTSLCAFLYGALDAAIYLLGEIGAEKAEYEAWLARLKEDFEHFWDENAGLYFDGDTDQTGSNDWKPENAEKKYYTRQSNTLAVLYGLCTGERAKNVMEKVAKNEMPEEIGIQPYFLHYVLSALRRTGQFAEYGFEILGQWKETLVRCKKGLAEAFGGFGDCSHAWGGTPTYQLPVNILGLTILEPGMKRVLIEPKLMGLEYADVNIPTPYGVLSVSLKEGDVPVVNVPEGMEVIARIGSNTVTLD